MKSKILLIAMGLCIWMQTGCKKNGPDDMPGRPDQLAKEGNLLATDFCTLTDREPELHFGLDRNASNNLYVFTENQLNTGLANFHTMFKYSDSGLVQNLDSSKQVLGIAELVQLFELVQTDSSLHYNPDSNYSALRMHFGMEAKKIILIYEPVVLRPTAIAKECAVTGSGKYFRVDASGNLITLSLSACSVLISNLTGPGSKVHMTHPNNPGIFNFINNNDATGDIRSNIISFQQVIRMYCDNNATALSSLHKINFTIVADRDAALTSNYRMHVVPNYRLGLSTPVTGTYKNYAADYTQMCPTSCNIVQVNYYE